MSVGNCCAFSIIVRCMLLLLLLVVFALVFNLKILK